MWTIIGVTAGFITLIGLLVFLSNKNGKQNAQLDMLKKSAKRIAKEQARANKIMDNVRGMSSDTVSDRLHKISSK